MELVDIRENPVPEGAVVGTITTVDGFTLRFARWPATSSKRKGTVCLFQGRAEFIEKYFETVVDLRKRGFAVATLDWRGQGRSQRLLKDPRKGHIDDFYQYDRDLKAFLQQVVLPDCPPPYYAFAHSMGGQILMRLAKDRSLFDRMLLSAPMLGINTEPVPTGLARGLAAVLDSAGLGGRFVPGGTGKSVSPEPFAGNVLTSDPKRYDRNAAIVREAPDIAIGSPTNGWLHAAFRAIDRTSRPDFGGQVMVPVLIVAAGADHVVDYSAIERLSSELRAGTHLLIPSARHELLMERDLFREQLLAAFDAFIPGSPS